MDTNPDNLYDLAYEFGKRAALNKEVYNNPYILGSDMFDGFRDGYMQNYPEPALTEFTD